MFGLLGGVGGALGFGQGVLGGMGGNTDPMLMKRQALMQALGMPAQGGALQPNPQAPTGQLGSLLSGALGNRPMPGPIQPTQPGPVQNDPIQRYEGTGVRQGPYMPRLGNYTQFPRLSPTRPLPQQPGAGTVQPY